MLLSAFTLLHVLISLIGIFSGFILAFGMIQRSFPARWNSIFLITTILTSVTGFFFPVTHFMPSHAVGILSLLVLGLAVHALKKRHLQGGWRKCYAITALIALYLNTFVLVVQSFSKIPVLHALAPTQTETPFKIAQLALLLGFVWFGTVATRRFQNPATAPGPG